MYGRQCERKEMGTGSSKGWGNMAMRLLPWTQSVSCGIPLVPPPLRIDSFLEQMEDSLNPSCLPVHEDLFIN